MAQTDLEVFMEIQESNRRAGGNNMLLVARPTSTAKVEKLLYLQSSNWTIRMREAFDEKKRVQRLDRERGGEAVLPTLSEWGNRPQSMGQSLPTDEVEEVLEYLPSTNFTAEDQARFLEHTEKRLTPVSEGKWAASDRYPARFTHMPGKTDKEVVQNYYHRKYVEGICDQYPLPPRPSRDQHAKNVDNGFTRSGFTARGVPCRQRNSQAAAAPVICLPREQRARGRTSKSSQDEVETADAESEPATKANPRKRARDTGLPVPAPKRAKTQKATILSAAAPASSNAPSKKRSVETVDVGVGAVPEKKRAKKSAPNNCDDAFLKIFKELRCTPAKSMSASELAGKYLTSDLKLISYEDRPTPRSSTKSPNDNKGDSAAKISDQDGKLFIDEHLFGLVQVTLLLAHPLLCKQRELVVAAAPTAKAKKLNWGPSQWQLCGLVDVNKMTNIGHAMKERGMFKESTYPELYDAARVARDLQALAIEEEEQRPDGFWPDADEQIRGLLVKRPFPEVTNIAAPLSTTAFAKLPVKRLKLTYKNAQRDLQRMIDAGEVGAPAGARQTGDVVVQEDAGGDGKAMPASPTTPSACSVSTDPLPSLTFSRTDSGTMSPITEAPLPEEPTLSAVAGRVLFAPASVGEQRELTPHANTAAWLQDASSGK